jgi:hypothetical protein
MKKLQQFCPVVVLTLVLTFSAFGGDISIPGATSPTPPPPSSVAGDMGTPGATATGEIQFPGVVKLDPVTEAALSLLQSILFLF